MRLFIGIILMLACSDLSGQIGNYPYIEDFDSIAPPALPPGWGTTTNRTSAGDFTTTKSSPYSDSIAVISTNSTIGQSLISPSFDFSERRADSLNFFERRSASHNSGLLIEASPDGGATFGTKVSDTLKNPGNTSYLFRKFKLPEDLNGLSAVKFRWRVVGDGTGASGTIRFDQITVTALCDRDILVASINFSPPNPVAGDSVFVQATLKNAGVQPAGDVTAEFYIDLNRDSVPGPEELFYTASSLLPLQPGDELIFQALLPDLPAGEVSIFVISNSAGDQDPLNNVSDKRLTVGLPPYSVVVNEIMYSPKNPEPEWVELFNNSPDTVNLNNWKLSNRYSSSKHPITDLDISVPPGNYCLLTGDLAAFTLAHPDIPSSVMEISSLPTYYLNNTGDAVVLFDSRDAVMDSVHYFPSWGKSAGISLERIESSRGSNDSSNWGPSGDPEGSSPGRQNFLTPLENDLRITSAGKPDPATIRIALMNSGRQAARDFYVTLYHDADNDSANDQSELVGKTPPSYPILPGDSASFDFPWTDRGSGTNSLIVIVDYPADMRQGDNILRFDVKDPFCPGQIVINEIMYQPRASGAEYVELCNNSQSRIEISEWKLTDGHDTSAGSKFMLSKSPLFVEPGEFLTIAFDSAILYTFAYLVDSSFKKIIRDGLISLNNEGDAILLRDLTGNMIDSLRYDPSWHNAGVEETAGRSLEKINPKLHGGDMRNWSSSANPLGGSPSMQNSLFTPGIPNGSSLRPFPNPFSPDGDPSGAFLPYYLNRPKTA